MPLQVVNGAATVCTLGTAPSKLLVLPTHRRTAGGQPAANIQDHVPTMNIAPFGLCKSPTFPGTIAATSAALGVFTPAPCVPLTDTPWIPGSPIVTIADQPALRQTDVCQCFWGGTVSITDPGQKIVDDK
jgi:hypothetical protein